MSNPNFIEAEVANFESERIEGYARAAHDAGHPSYFSVPLISEILPNLWMGGVLPGVTLPDHFKYVVSLYSGSRYIMPAGTFRQEIKMLDHAEMPDLQELRETAAFVNACRKEGTTLVHCQAGLNRSALVTALALIMDGMTPEGAIKLLRTKRCELVLCNETFERWLLEEAVNNE